MQDVTDGAFWNLMHRYGGADVYWTEYFRVHAVSRPESWIVESIENNSTGRPVIAQMIGNDIPSLVRTAKELQQLPVAAIDLNLGCPAPIVYRKCAGGGLLREPQRIDAILGALRDAVRRGEDRGVTLCLEPLGPAETDFINTAAETVRFIREVNSPRLKVILDVKAMSSESVPIPEIIRATWPDFAYFHANDRNLKGPGFGDVDFRPIAAALHEVGYAGTVSVEVFNFDEGPEVIATRSLAYLRETFAR